jgi:hypothetical protein
MKNINSSYIPLLIFCIFFIYLYYFFYIVETGMTPYSGSISAINLQQISNFWEGRWFQTTLGWRTHNEPLNVSNYGYGHTFIRHIMVTHLLLAFPCSGNLTLQCSYTLQIVFNTSILIVFLILYIKAGNTTDKVSKIILVLFLIVSTGLFLRLLITSIQPANYVLGLFLLMHYFYKRGYKILFIIFFILICFLQEDLSLFVASYFLYQFLFSKNKNRGLEITLFILGCLYFSICQFYIMPLAKFNLSSIAYSSDILSRFDNGLIDMITPKNIHIVVFYLLPSVIVLYIANKYVNRFIVKDYLFLLIVPSAYWWSLLFYSANINHKYSPIFAVLVILICDKINDQNMNIKTRNIFFTLVPVLFVSNIAFIPAKSFLISKFINSSVLSERIERNKVLVEYIQSIPKHNTIGIIAEKNLLGFFSNRPHIWTGNDDFVYKSNYIVIQKYIKKTSKSMFRLYFCDVSPFICAKIDSANNYFPNSVVLDFINDKSSGYRLIVNNEYYSTFLRESDKEIVDIEFSKQIFGFIPPNIL